MYEKLIDTVCDIAKTHGVPVLSEPKFWNILRDSYPFGSDRKLKSCFQYCINRGYVRQLLGKTKKADALDYIRAALDRERGSQLFAETAIAGCLFSIAIAAGTCNVADYTDFNRNPVSNRPPTPNPHPNPTPQPNATSSKLTIKEKLQWFLIVFLGIFVILANITLYFAIFYGWSFILIIFYGASLQLGYWLRLTKFITNTNDGHFKNIVASCVYPIAIALLLINLCSFFFFSDTVLNVLGNYLQCHDRYYAPGGVSFVLCLIYAVVFVCLFRSAFFSNTLGISKSNILKKPRFRTAVGISLIVALWVSIPAIHQISQNYRIGKLRDAIANPTKPMVLSFKGIELGSPFSSTAAVVRNIDDFKEDFNENEFPSAYSLTFNSRETIINMLSSFNSTSAEFVHDGLLISGETTLDDIRIKVAVLEYNKLTQAIIIRPKNDVGKVFEDIDFSNIISLYQNKYGDPQKIPQSEITYVIDGLDKADSTGNYSRLYEEYIYVWAFKNGQIWLSRDYIVYVTSEYYSLLNQQITLYRQAVKRENDSIATEERKREAEIRRRETEDSLKRVSDHIKAQSEI